MTPPETTKTSVGAVQAQLAYPIPTDIDKEDADMSTDDLEIKEEIIIKEEIEIGEECIIIPANFIRNQKCVPVVYTTRLDDMKIFSKNFESLTVDDIVENIILESKPQFTQSVNKQTECIVIFDDPFIKLSEKIKQLNELTALVSDESKKVISLDSYNEDDVKVKESNTVITLESSDDEDFVPLELLSTKRVDPTFLNDRLKKTEKPGPKKISAQSCQPCNVRLVATNKFVIFNGEMHLIYDKANENSTKFIEGVLYKVGIGSLLLFRDLREKNVEIFVFGKDGLYINIVKEENFSKQIFKFAKYNTMYIDVCCWFRRECVLNSIIFCDNINQTVFHKAHACSPNECDCCCKTKYINTEKNPVLTLKEKSVESSDSNLLSQEARSEKESQRNDFVNNSKLVNNNHITALTGDDGSLGVQMLKHNGETEEFYEFKSDGSVKHFEMERNHMDIYTQFQKAMKSNADSDKLICCWRKRDAMLKSFELKHIPMISQFVRTPHPCPPDRCMCCCKPQPYRPTSPSSDKVERLRSPNYFSDHAYNYTSLITRRKQLFIKPENKNKTEPHQYDCKNEPVDLETSSTALKSFAISVDNVIDKTISLAVNKNNIAQSTLTENQFVPYGVSPSILNSASEKYIYMKKQVIEKKSNNLSKETALSRPLPTPTQPSAVAAQFVKIVPRPTPVQPVKVAPLIPKRTQPQPPPVLNPLYELQAMAENSILPTKSAPAQSNVTVPANEASALGTHKMIRPQKQKQDSTVNTLINSLLHRFHDVRLIITPDGNVSAEINKPMQDLTTSELQILSKILTHAREQVKILKAAGHLNATSNTVINPWPTKIDSNTNSSKASYVNMPVGNVVPVITPDKPTTTANTNLSRAQDVKIPAGNTVSGITQDSPTAPHTIIPNKNSRVDAPTMNIPNFSSTTSTMSSITTTNKENAHTGPSKIDAFQCYTNLSALKMKEYLTSCRAYLNDVQFAPKIKHVFSLTKNTTTSNKPSKIASNRKRTTTYIPDSDTSGVKRKRQPKPRGDTKKRKTAESNKSDTSKAMETDTVLTYVPPVNEPGVSTIQNPPKSPIIDMTEAPILSGLLNTPHILPTEDGQVLDPNQVYIAVPFGILPGSAPTMEVVPEQQHVVPVSIKECISDTEPNDDDCILGY